MTGSALRVEGVQKTGARVLAALAWAVLAALPAQAAVTVAKPVQLLAPGGYTNGVTTDNTLIDFNQWITTTILPGDGGEIGNFMLPLERIELSGNSILITAAQGATDGSTGYLGANGVHARYVFSGLDVAGTDIVGFSVFDCDGYTTSCVLHGVTAGIGVTMTDTDADNSLDTLTFNLDDLRFRNRGQGESKNFADFRIDLITNQTPPPPPGVPEPGTALLALLGLAAVVRGTRGRAARR